MTPSPALTSTTLKISRSNNSKWSFSEYSVEWQPDDHHLARVGNPRLYQHPYQSAQMELWQPGEVVWFVILSWTCG